jgi:hypothetical protein
MKSPRSSLASRYSVAFILCLSCLMILMASALSVSPSSSLGTPSTMAYDANIASTTREMFAKPLVSPLAPVGTTVTATKSHTPSGNRAPGDTLTYTVVIANTGAADATMVNFTDTIDPNTTFVFGSLKVSPIAVNDTYNTIGNVNISVPSGSGLLVNDLNPGGMGTLGFTLINATPFVSGSAVATTHGSVTVNTDGSFTYNPTAGFAGPTDSFTYTLGNGTGLTDTATVTINISGRIWFVNSAAGVNGDGRLSTPFNILTGAGSADSVDAANDVIFLYTSATNYTGGLTLNASEKLIGQGASQSILMITGFAAPSGTNLLPSTSGSNPTITSGALGVGLGTNNDIWGVTFGTTTGASISGTSFGTLKVRDTAKTGNGQALNLSTGVLDAIFQSISSTSSASTGMTLNATSGSFSVTGTTSFTNNSSGAAVNLTTNTSTITFAALNITNTTSNQAGVNATENTNTITTTSGVISTGTGTAVTITKSSTTTPLAVSLTSVTNSSATNGIKLTNVSGSFAVTGDGGASNNASGGTITTPVAEGVLISTASNVSLGYMNITNFGSDGINATGVNGFTLRRCNISDNAGNNTIDDGVTLTNTSGTLSITNNSITGSRHQGITIDNNNTNMASLTMTANTVSNTAGGDGVLMQMRGTSVLTTGTIGGATAALGNTFSGNSSTGLQVSNADTGNISSLLVQNNIVTTNNAGMDFDLSQGSSMTIRVLNNTFNNQVNQSLNVFAASTSTSGTMTATLLNNTLGTQGTFDSGGFGAIRCVIQNGKAGSITIDGNTIREVSASYGIDVEAIGHTSGNTVKVKITNNTVVRPTGTTKPTCGATPCPLSSIFVLSDTDSAAETVCTSITANTAYDPTSWPQGAGFAAYYLARRSGQALNLEGNTGQTPRQNILNNNTVTNLTTPGSGDFTDEAGNVTVVAVGTCGAFPTVAPPADFAAMRAGQSSESDGAANTGSNVSDTLTVVRTQPPPEGEAARLSQAALTWMVDAAITRWQQAGVSPEDITRMRHVQFELAGLSEGQIATASSSHIRIDETAAGYGWFFDQTPSEDSEFDVPVPGREFQTTQYSPAHGRIDLLTVLMRELGTVYMQGKKKMPKQIRPLMESTLAPSLRRLPDPSLVQIPQTEPSSFTTQSPDASASQSSGAQTSASSSTGRRAGRVSITGNLSPQSGETVTQALGTIPVSEQVTLTFQVTINNPLPANICTVTNPAPLSGVNVTGSNFTSVTIAPDSATIVKAPTIGTCPSNITKNTDPNVCTAVTTFTPPTSDACPAATVTCVPASGFAFPKGTTTVTCTAANGVLPNATCTFTVTVNDNQAPVLSGCTNITTNTAAGVCTATATYAPTATDNCDGSRPVTCIPASGSTFNKGVTTVTCSASDLNTPTANTGTCTFTVTVNDNQAPVLTGCTNISMNTAPGVCTATATYAPTATDNCDGSRPVTCVPASGSTFNKGVTTVNCSAIDTSNNTGTCSFTVTVVDNQAPVLSGCTNITTNTAPGVCTAAPTYTPTATDNCDGSRPVTCVPASGSTFNKGVTTVACSASDLSSNTGNCSFTVTVNDNQAPVLSGCTNQTIDAGPGVCTATATYMPTATDNCDGARPVTCVPASGSTFNKGVTTVSCSASDTSSNTGMCTFTITVNDNQAPVVTCPASGGAFAASDCLPSQSSAYTGATLYSVGSNTVTNAVLSGFTPCTAPPVSGMATINFTGILTGDLSMGGPPAHFQAPVSGSMKVTFNNLTGSTRTFDTEMLQLDISGGNLPAGVQLRESPTLMSTGQTKITTVTGGFHIDSFFDVFTELSTNSGSSWTPDPTARHIAAVQSTDANACNAVVNYPAATATDNCPGVSAVTCVPASGTTFAKGTTTVTCSATDAGNLTGNCSFTVTVVDTQLPTLTCPSNINVIGNACSVQTYTTPTPSDNCPGSTASCSPASGTCFAVGTTTVTCTATDTSANTNSCTFTVTVTPCTITCPGNIVDNVAPGTCAHAETYLAPTTTGMCGTVTCSPVSGSSFPKGVTTVTCSTTAGPGCTFTVTINDNEAPVLSGCNNVSAFTASNACSAVVNYTQPTASDVCDGSRTVTCTPTAGSTFPKGVTTVSCSASDTSNNTGMCTFTVTVTDNVAPVFSGCTNVSAFTATNACNAVVNYTQPTATDNCDGARPVVCSPAAGSTFQKGVTTVTCTASDLNMPTANTATCMFTVTVTDNVAPVLSGCTNLSAFTASNSCNAVVTYTQPTANDNCDGSRTVTCVPASGSAFNKGVTTVTCSAMDTSNNTGMCTFTVTVTDNVAPVLSGCTNVTANTASNACNAVVSYTQPTANDNCDGARTVTCSPTAGSVFPKGVTTVSCSASDTSNNTGNCTFTVTVTDNVAPVLSGCNNVTANTASNSCTAVVSYTQPTANDNCDGARTVTCSPASGSTFNKGVTTVSCSATDTSNNTGTCTFTVTVNDATPPVITCPANVTKSTDPNVCTAMVTYPNATATDNCPGVGTPVCTPASGTTFQKGVTTVTCTVNDSSKNSSNCSFTVTVNDTQNPTVTCPNNMTFTTPGNNDPCLIVNYTPPSGSDNCGIQSVMCTPAPGFCFLVGMTTVTCTATDTSGNHGSCTFKITVQNPCTITCPANITKNNDANQCGAVVTFAPMTTGGGCGTVACTPASGSFFPKGTTTVTCTTSGPSCSFTVTVIDAQAPNIMCPANITKTTDPNVCQAVVTYPAPMVSDNCPGVGAPTCSPASGTTFPKGTTTVTCTVKDSSNNMSMCNFTVTVVDMQPPTITCPANIFVAASSVTCLSASSQTVNYPPATATDNCPGVTVVCSPASGSVFPAGTTTVTCIATDASGNTASCSFTVTVFTACLVDQTNAGNVVLFNAQTGAYRFCCNGQLLASGTGMVNNSQQHCEGTIDDTKGVRRVHIQYNFTAGTGTASLFLSGSDTAKCTITRGRIGNVCTCPSAPPPIAVEK